MHTDSDFESKYEISNSAKIMQPEEPIDIYCFGEKQTFELRIHLHIYHSSILPPANYLNM